MRIRVLDRILVGLAGLILLAGCAGLVAQLFFGVDVTGFATRFITTDTTARRIALIAMAVLLLLLGVYCLMVLFRHRRRKDRFILQKTEDGELAISLKAMLGMVTKCLDQFREVTPEDIHLENDRDGLLVRIRGSVAGGISIPLTVEAMQKQIRQYVTACSGVEVKGIRVQIESSGPDLKDAPFAIAAPEAPALLREGEEPALTAPEESQEIPMEQISEDPAVPATPEPPELVATLPPEDIAMDDDDRPMHQRLFAPRQEPCIVPPPPQEDEEEPAETEPAEGAEIPVTDAPEAPETQEIPEMPEIPETEETAEEAPPADIPTEMVSEDFAEDAAPEPEVLPVEEPVKESEAKQLPDYWDPIVAECPTPKDDPAPEADDE